ncbi:MAG: HIT domain-containing protein [Nanoarchaeota archaeon]|nr:HIT domain-containing protein [Nanoarchaeota archaeon]
MQQMTEEQRKQLEEKLKNMSPEELREFQKQNCIFCTIISGKIPSRKVYEDESSLAVLDIRPAAKGHILILPKEHYAILPQVPEKEIAHLFSVAKHLSQVTLQSLRSDGTTLFIANGPVAGQQAQHVMLHLIPRKEGDGLFAPEEKVLPKNLLQKVQAALQEPLQRALGGEQKERTSAKKGERMPKKEKVSDLAAEADLPAEEPREESREEAEEKKVSTEEKREQKKALEEIAEHKEKKPPKTEKMPRGEKNMAKKTPEKSVAEESSKTDEEEAQKKRRKKQPEEHQHDGEHIDLEEIAELFR